ncbi:hypothetical protein HL667_23240 [Bradyrhizobium sp. 83012]|uniref:Lipoprotein n=1 Tax=Bradyrhizobium aeschynomenes TaxID=2734909 RepID=A0ABX2CI93_9BRAD|nr:hypothetical protein [Bradyrhizobium aeschynomenes]NPU14123.1 hypothetical protein [Bradyrhizobium aeschynomenes]NPU67936.1 hypothetical protein [Bradyrhizobium aeschynomenes]
MKSAAMVGVSVLGLMIACPTAPMSEQLTLACRFEGSEPRISDVQKDVNQLYIDTDTPMIELRIAQTMGTANPAYWTYRTRSAKGMTDDKVFLYFVGSKMSMAALRLGVPTAIVLDRLSGSMVWSWADESGSFVYRYGCKP